MPFFSRVPLASGRVLNRSGTENEIGGDCFGGYWADPGDFFEVRGGLECPVLFAVGDYFPRLFGAEAGQKRDLLPKSGVDVDHLTRLNELYATLFREGERHFSAPETRVCRVDVARELASLCDDNEVTANLWADRLLDRDVDAAKTATLAASDIGACEE